MASREKQGVLRKEHHEARKIVAELEALLGAFTAPAEPQLVRLEPKPKEEKNDD
jgi:hypothetical protein